MDLLKKTIAKTPVMMGIRLATQRYGRVLLYHQIVEDDYDPLLRQLVAAITRSSFQRQLDYLQKHYRVVSLRDLLDQADHPHRMVAITFDDGYADNLRIALPELEARGMTATIFVTSGFVGSRSGAWWNRLARMIVDNGPKPLVLGGSDGEVRFPFDGRYDRQMKEAAQWLDTLPPDERTARFDERFGREEDRFLTADELGELTGRGVAVEGHTISHPRLSALGPEDLARELVESKATLEQLTSRDVRYVAYPFGGAADISPQVIEAARRAGYEAAFTTRSGLVGPGVDRFAVPRIGAHEEFHRFQLRVERFRKSS